MRWVRDFTNENTRKPPHTLKSLVSTQQHTDIKTRDKMSVCLCLFKIDLTSHI